MVVLDTNVIVHARGSINFDKILIVPDIVTEVESRHGKNILRNIDYEIQEASEHFVERVEKKSVELDSPTSEVDEKLLALALEEEDTLVTDDKALQNLALHLEVEVDGFQDEVLEEEFAWEKVCSNCGKEISSLPCPRCGSDQARRRQVRCN